MIDVDGDEAKFPKAPQPIKSWEIYHHIYMNQIRHETNEEENANFYLSRIMLLKQLKLLGNTKCEACSGYGHRAGQCPTSSRISLVGHANHYHGRYIALARIHAR